jgi:anti-sigma factor (TIGR02949 family)
MAPLRAECRQTESFLDAYVDGEFDAREAAELEAHLAGCADCTAKARRQESYKAALRRAGGSCTAPARLREAVRARLDDPRSLEELGLDDDADPRPARARWWSGTRGIAVAAAAAGAAVWFAVGGLERPVFFSATRIVEDGVALHARTLPLDFVASDASAVQHWLQGKLDFGVRLPAFRQAAALQGVRLSTVRARQAAAVAYSLPQAASRRVTLLIVDAPEVQLSGTSRRVADREVWLSHARGYNVASWRHDEIVYSLISDLDERDVLELVRAAQDR